MSIPTAGSPSRPLISNGDSCDAQSMLIGEDLQPPRELLDGLRPESLPLVGRDRYLMQHGTLTLHPLDVPTSERMSAKVSTSSAS